jgi:hypothetical protein
MKLKRWFIVIILGAFVATVAGYGLNGVWAQDTPQIQVSGGTSDPTLLAKGAGLSVPFNITCTGTEQVTWFYESLEIRQRVSKDVVATTYGSVGAWDAGSPLVCNGQTQTVAVRTLSPEYPFYAPFKKGTALVTGYVEVCGLTDTSVPEYPQGECAYANISQEVRIK